MDSYKQKLNKRCGPGGLRCDCCNDFKGKDKKKLNRLARRDMKKELDKLQEPEA